MFLKKYTFLIAVFIVSFHAFSNVTVTSGGNLTMCVGTAYTTIGKITIAEGVAGDFSANPAVQSYEINAPSNFEFNQGSGSVTVSGADITFSALTVTSTKITLYYLLNAVATIDKFELTNIQIRATNPSGSQNIVRTGGSAVQAGNNAYGSTHASVASSQANVSLSLGSQAALCVNASNQVLTGGNPGGGTFSGPFVTSGTTFSPGTAGVGSYIVTYTATQNGCPGTATATIKVNSKPSVTFFGLDNTYCSNGEDDQLTGFPSGGTFSGSAAISGTLFRPSVPSVGVKSITYAYTDANGCSDSYTLATTILEVPTVTITLTEDKNSYAINDVPVIIGGTQNNPSSGGTILLSGNGVSNSAKSFTPSSAGAGTHTIYRKFTAPNGCSATAERQVTVANTNNVIIVGLGAKYCEYDAPSTLSTYLGLGTYSGNGIVNVNSGAGTAVFDPSKVDFGGQQQVNITITLTYPGLLPFVERTVVHKKPVVSIVQDTVAPNFRNKFCNQDALVPISVLTFPAGGSGTFSGTGIQAISGNTFNPSKIIDTNSIVYTYTDPNGCINKDTVEVIVNAVTTNLDFTDIDPSYCDKAAAVPLKPLNGGSPFEGGVFNGVGINGNTFNPEIAAQYNNGNKSQDYVLTYTYVNKKKCATVVQKTTKVYLSPKVILSGLNETKKYCYGDPSITLTGSPSADGVGYYGITPVASTVLDPTTMPDNIFNPNNKTNPGSYVVYYNYTETSSTCSSRDSAVVIVNAIPEVYFSGLKEKYCDKEDAVELTAYPPYKVGASSFTNSPEVNAIAGTKFSPTFAGVNTHYVTYTYTDANGCKGDSTIKTVVYEKPKADFTISSVCEKDLILFRDLSSVLQSPSSAPSTYNKWQWVIDDKTTLRKDLDTALSAGPHRFTYITTTNVGCGDTVTKNMIIGSYPNTSFTWDKICNKEETKFFNTSTINVGTITNVVWRFSDIITDKDSIPLTSTVKGHTAHTYTTPATYNVILKAETDYNCIARDTQKVFILPSVTIKSSEPYSNNFNDMVGDWVSSSEIDTLSSWELGMPNKSVIKSTNPAWVTSLTKSHKPEEISYVYSPCFTLTDITRPMIHMDIWSGTIEKISGANLQYSIDGTNWNTLGKPDESGINWYNNTNNIPTRPSGVGSLDQNGWTGTDTAWKNVRHVFDNEIGTNKNIRFRISFAGSVETTNGFAFDNVWIGDRNRLLLAEHFTNSSSLYTKDENNSINKLISDNMIQGNAKDIVSLQYHTAFPGPDEMYSRNIPDAGARSLYYGVTQVPYSVVDGSYYKGSALNIKQTTVDTRSLYDPAFDVTLNQTTVISDSLWGSITIKNKIPVSNNITVYISILERYVNNITGTNGETTFQWVHSKFLPDAAGTTFSANWQGNRTEIIPFNWKFSSSTLYNTDKLAIIAFVQDNVTKEIYQTAYKGLGATVTTGVFNPNEQTSTVMLYPNPANNLLNVILSGTLAGDYLWAVVDGLGRVFDQGVASDQADGFVINTEQYADGFYTLRLSNAADGVKTQKFVVVH
jgi:hypothetical protein